MPDIDNPTALGAALHGAVAAGVMPDSSAAAAHFDARSTSVHAPGPEAVRHYHRLAADGEIRATMHALTAYRRS